MLKKIIHKSGGTEIEYSDTDAMVVEMTINASLSERIEFSKRARITMYLSVSECDYLMKLLCDHNNYLFSKLSEAADV